MIYIYCWNQYESGPITAPEPYIHTYIHTCDFTSLLGLGSSPPAVFKKASSDDMTYHIVSNIAIFMVHCMVSSDEYDPLSHSSQHHRWQWARLGGGRIDHHWRCKQRELQGNGVGQLVSLLHRPARPLRLLLNKPTA